VLPVPDRKSLGLQLINKLVQFVQINACFETEVVRSGYDAGNGARSTPLGQSAPQSCVNDLLERQSLLPGFALQDQGQIVIYGQRRPHGNIMM
jgi:hypothetical protein